MDLTTSTPTKITPDSENETPPQTQQQQTKSLPFTNGALKKHHHHHHHLIPVPPPPPPAAAVTYKECLKNHAASLGGHALDGCGEFMPSPNDPTSLKYAPTSLKCAACGCHRNFHRREPDVPTTALFLDFRHHVPPRRASLSPSPPPPPPPSSYHSSAPHMLLALSAAVSEDHPTATHHQLVSPATPTAVKTENPIGRKRFRTKFSQDQREKMFSFSENLGWKMQKCDEALVEKFCNEIGVRKGVLKVWMHNNKHNFVKKSEINNNNNNNNSGIDRVRFDSSDHKNNIDGLHDLHVSGNGSSSSS